MEQSSALSSHDPRCFASKPQSQPQPQPQPRSETTHHSAARLLFKAHWKVNTESAREEPRLRRLLGHISVYDRTRTFAQEQAQAQAETQTQTQPSAETEPNELSVYIRHQVPSFKEFQAALEAQLETIAQIRAAAALYNNAEEYNSDEEEEGDDSDYDSCDGDWSDDDEDTSAESDDSSCTDYESEGQRSECSSPTFDSARVKYDQEDEEDVWAIRPLVPLVSNRSADSG